MSALSSYRAPRWFDLVQGLAHQLSVCPPDPFELIDVVVSSAGAGSVLKSQLAGLVGQPGATVCAGLVTSTPAQFQARFQAEHSIVGDADPWRISRLTFEVRHNVERLLDDPAFVLVRNHLHHARESSDSRPPASRDLVFANRIARLFKRYLAWHPAMVQQWSDGVDVDDERRPLRAADQWQPILWRSLIASIPGLDPIARHDAMLNAVGPGRSLHLVALPDLSAQDIEFFEALANHRQVSWWECGSQPVNSLAKPVHFGAEPHALPSTTTTTPVVEFHGSHGVRRQVEVLREVLTAAFADDPTLEPRDVLVRVSNPEYLPHIEALFSRSEHNPHPAREMRVSIAAESRMRQNLVRDALAFLLRLFDTRATLDDLFRFAANPLVARAFNLDATSLARMRELCEAVNIRWGIDPRHRASWGVTSRANTWIFGVDRLLAGLCERESSLRSFDTVLPSDAVAASDAPIVGALAELVTRIRKFLFDTAQPMPVAQWMSVLDRQLDAFIEVSYDDAWMLRAVRARLCSLGAIDDAHPYSAAQLGAVIESLLGDDSPRPNHGSGAMSVTDPIDLAFVDFKVVCVLGANIAPVEPLGDQITRESDRQSPADALWRAVTSATQRAILVFEAYDERTLALLPEPALISRLRHDLSANGITHTPLRRHSLNADNPSNFDTLEPASFDAIACEAARARLHPRAHEPQRDRLIDRLGRQVAPVVDELTIDDLDSWLKSPAGFFLTRRADQRTFDAQASHDSIPIELDALSSWGVGNRILEALLAGVSLEEATRAEWLRGAVGPGQFGADVINAAATRACAVVDLAEPLMDADLVAHPLRLTIGDTVIDGHVSTFSDRIVDVRYGSAYGHPVAGSWIRALCARASGLDVESAHVIGSNKRGSKIATHQVLRIPSIDEAQERLAIIVGSAVQGLHVPSPFIESAAMRVARQPSLDASGILDTLKDSFDRGFDRFVSQFYGSANDLLAQPATNPRYPNRFTEIVATIFYPMDQALEAYRG